MNLAEMVSLFRIYTDDPKGDRWDRPEIITLLNRSQEAVQDLVDLADEGYFRACERYTVATDNDSWEGELPTDFKALILAERERSPTPIKVRFAYSFKNRHKGFGDTSVTPAGWTSEPMGYITGTKIGIISPQEGFTLRVWYIKRAPTLSDDNDTSLIPLEFHDLVVLDAAQRSILAEGQKFALETLTTRRRNEVTTFLEERQRQEPRHATYIDRHDQ